MQTWQIKDLTPEQLAAVHSAFAILSPHFPITNLAVSDGLDVNSDAFLKPVNGKPTQGYIGPVTIIENMKFRMMPIYFASAELGNLIGEAPKPCG